MKIAKKATDDGRFPVFVEVNGFKKVSAYGKLA